jgi:hypothetical protein
MSAQSTSDYMLLFRGTHWHEGLSPEEIQKVVNQMKACFDRLTAEGKAKAGKPLFHEGWARLLSRGVHEKRACALAHKVQLPNQPMERRLRRGASRPPGDVGHRASK